MGFYFLMPWWASLPAITNWYVSYQKIKRGYSLVTYSSLGIDILIYRWVFLYTYGEGFSSWDSTRRFWLASRRSWWPRWLAIGRSAGGGGGVVDVYARAGKTGPYFYSVFLLMLRGVGVGGVGWDVDVRLHLQTMLMLRGGVGWGGARLLLGRAGDAAAALCFAETFAAHGDSLHHGLCRLARYYIISSI